MALVEAKLSPTTINQTLEEWLKCVIQCVKTRSHLRDTRTTDDDEKWSWRKAFSEITTRIERHVLNELPTILVYLEVHLGVENLSHFVISKFIQIFTGNSNQFPSFPIDLKSTTSVTNTICYLAFIFTPYSLFLTFK